MSTTNSPAVDRGIQMMGMPMRDLPAEAFIFCGYMCQRYAMCGEVMLTAYCYYAQIVEGLACDDELYRASEVVRADWAHVQREWERVSVDGRLVARWRPAKVGERFRFEYEGVDARFNKILAVTEVQGTDPESLVFFDDTTHSKQKDLTGVPRFYGMRLVWYQRADGRWNADCTCGASVCGIQFEERGVFEQRHFAYVEKERERRLARPPCGPKFPDLDNPYLPRPLVFP